jgi:hypothetical protein
MTDPDICPKCHKKRPRSGYDACLGYLPGVVSACCGHGKDRGFITWKNGTAITFSSDDLAVSRAKTLGELLREELWPWPWPWQWVAGLRLRKAGYNDWPSQVKKRPAPPGRINTSSSEFF